MKNIIASLLILSILVVGCNKGGSGYSSSPSGLQYVVHTKNEGPKAKIGDFVTLHMQYATEKDSIIFSSYKNNRPLSFKFQETLFKGALNDGITQMSAGDSATLLVPVDSIYGDRVPNFTKKGDKLKYTITLLKVQTQEEYTNERETQRKTQDEADKKLIADYVAAKGLKMQSSASGLQYNIEKQGSGTVAPEDDLIAKMRYNVKLLDGTEIESSKGNGTDMPMNRQTRGVREAISLLKKGGKGSFIIPSTLAYGDRQRGTIPANAILVYDMEILDLVPNQSSPKGTNEQPAQLQKTIPTPDAQKKDK